MQAIRISSYGGPEVARLEDTASPEPTGTEIVVRVKAAGVNPVDWKIRRGDMRFLNLQLPMTMGCDLAGTVETGAGPFQAGDDIFAYTALTRNGAFAEYALVLPNEAALKPKTLGFLEAASIPVAALTAWQALFQNGSLQPGQKILIHGAGGAVGAMAVQLAKWKGAYVIGTGSGSNLEYLRKVGADETIDYKTEKFEDKAHDVDFVFDTVGGETYERSFAVLRDGGTLVSTLQHPSPSASPQRGIHASMVGVVPNGATLSEIAKLIDSGKLTTRIDSMFPLSKGLDALALSESGKAKGKIVIDMG